MKKTDIAPGAGSMAKPVVSIVICTFNRAAQLPKALDALLTLDCETPWEAIILDNNSTDDTSNVIASYAARDPRIVPAFEEQQGLGAARDTAWRHARGEIISFTDDDCYVSTDYVDALKQVFFDHPNWAFVGGKILLHNAEDIPLTIDLRNIPVGFEAKTYVKPGAFHGANLSFKRVVLEEIDGFSRNMGAGTPFPCEDIDTVARVVWAGHDGGFHPAPVVSHDHGRREEHRDGIMEGYQRGGAAYYARFLSKKTTSSIYRNGLFQTFKRQYMKPIIQDLLLFYRHGNKFLNDDRAGGHIQFSYSLFSVFFRLLNRKLMNKLRGLPTNI